MIPDPRPCVDRLNELARHRRRAAHGMVVALTAGFCTFVAAVFGHGALALVFGAVLVFAMAFAEHTLRRAERSARQFLETP